MIIALHHELKRIWKLEKLFGPKMGVTKHNLFIDLKGGCTEN